MSDLPDPPVPAEVDLTVYPSMPIEIRRLQRSAAWRACKRRPELAFYMLNLWMAAWHERPTASLEDDDEALADLAMCPPEIWPEVKEQVMRGWVRCSDGRLYHRVVAEKALEAHDKKRSKTEHSRGAALARWGRRTGAEEPPTHRENDASAMPEHADALPEQCQLMPIDAKEEKDKKEGKDTNETRARACEGFDEFWDEYPHKVGEPAAETAYRAALAYADHPTIVAGVRRYRATKPPDRQWCNPAKWLLERRWLDQPAEARGSRLNGTGPPAGQDHPTGPPPPLPIPH